MAAVSISPLSGHDTDRLRNLHLGRSEFEAFSVPADGGRTLTVIVTSMDMQSLQAVMSVPPTHEPAESADAAEEETT